MCLYVSHVRVCGRCRHEVTVLISESLCSAARLSGVFASCGTGPGSQRSPKRYQCWGCRENEAEDVEDVEAEAMATAMDTATGANTNPGTSSSSSSRTRTSDRSSGGRSGSGSFSSTASSVGSSSRGYHWPRRGSMK